MNQRSCLTSLGNLVVTWVWMFQLSAGVSIHTLQPLHFNSCGRFSVEEPPQNEALLGGWLQSCIIGNKQQKTTKTLSKLLL